MFVSFKAKASHYCCYTTRCGMLANNVDMWLQMVPLFFVCAACQSLFTWHVVFNLFFFAYFKIVATTINFVNMPPPFPSLF